VISIEIREVVRAGSRSRGTLQGRGLPQRKRKEKRRVYCFWDLDCRVSSGGTAVMHGKEKCTASETMLGRERKGRSPNYMSGGNVGGEETGIRRSLTLKMGRGRKIWSKARKKRCLRYTWKTCH